MNYDYIVNPLTNRKCNINSRNGQRILNQYLIQEGGDECGFNPKTNRCSKSAKEFPEKCELGEKGRCRLKKGIRTAALKVETNKEDLKSVTSKKDKKDKKISTIEPVKQISEFEKATILKVIKGPSFSYYLPRMKLKGETGPGRNFLILGEYHTSVPDCDSVAQSLSCFNKWIHYVAKNSPYCLDFFFEGPSYTLDKNRKFEMTLKPKEVINYQDGSGMIDMIRGYFEVNDIRRFKNTRMHTVDLRIINQTINQGKTPMPKSYKYTEVFQSFLQLGYDRMAVNAKFDKVKNSLIDYIDRYIFFLIYNVPDETLNILFDNIANDLNQPITVKHYITLLNNLRDKLVLYSFLDKKYDVIEEFLKPNEPKFFDVEKFKVLDIAVGEILGSKIEGIILIAIMIKGFQSQAKKVDFEKLDEVNKEIFERSIEMTYKIIEYIDFIQDVLYSYNEQISYSKSVIERQLSKSLLEKNDFIKNKDIWFSKDDVKASTNLMNNLRPHSFLMDVYTLSRMFGVFEESKLNRGPLKCRDVLYKTPRNIIFYGGQNHSKRYAQFIDRLNQGENKSTVISTVDMAEAKQCHLSNMLNCKHIDYTLKKGYKNGFNFFENVI